MGFSIIDWLGLRSDENDPDAGIPSWQGATKRQKWGSLAFWTTAAVIIYVALDARMPHDDGIGGFAPLYLASLSWNAGLRMTERSFLRDPPYDQ